MQYCLSQAQGQDAGEPAGCDQVRNCQALTKVQHSNRLARRRCGRPLVSSCLCPMPCVLCKASVMTVPCSRHLPVLLPSRVVAAVNHHARGTVVMYLPRRGCSLPRGRFFGTGEGVRSSWNASRAKPGGGYILQRKDPPYFRRVNGIYIAPCPPCAGCCIVGRKPCNCLAGCNLQTTLQAISKDFAKRISKEDRPPWSALSDQRKECNEKECYQVIFPLVHAIIIYPNLFAFNRIIYRVGLRTGLRTRPEPHREDGEYVSMSTSS